MNRQIPPGRIFATHISDKGLKNTKHIENLYKSIRKRQPN